MTETTPSYWVKFDDIDTDAPQTPVTVQYCRFIGEPFGVHIHSTGSRIYIQNVTMFSGYLTPKRALKWAISEWKRETQNKIRRIKWRVSRFLPFYRGDEY